MKDLGKKYFLLFSLFIVIDQLSKYIIRLRHLAGDGFYICNPGVAFGIRIPDAIFWLIWVLIVFLLTKRLLSTHGSKKMGIYIVIFLAGAVANAIDRVFFGCVIDFIDFGFWPVFNLADAFIIVGGALVVHRIFIKKDRMV